MNTEFESLPWHDAELLSITIDRTNSGCNDIVNLSMKWPNGHQSNVIFNDCYFMDMKMNFGVIAKETILEAICLNNCNQITSIKAKWQTMGVNLNNIHCYRLITNSTNSRIDIYALSFNIELP